METLELQLVTVELDNGDAGVFVGIPLVHERMSDADCQVCDIWFSDTQPVHIRAGDLVTFPAGMACEWDVRAPVRKHYRFG